MDLLHFLYGGRGILAHSLVWHIYYTCTLNVLINKKVTKLLLKLFLFQNALLMRKVKLCHFTLNLLAKDMAHFASSILSGRTLLTITIMSFSLPRSLGQPLIMRFYFCPYA